MDDVADSAPWPWPVLGQATRSLGMSVCSPVKENRSYLPEAVVVSRTAFLAEMNLILASVLSSLFSTQGRFNRVRETLGGRGSCVSMAAKLRPLELASPFSGSHLWESRSPVPTSVC